MDEQTQAQFIEWLAQQLGVSSEEELNAAVEQMGEEGLQQAFQQFQQETQAQAMKEGGKLNYIKNLQAFRKGGKTKGKIKNGAKDGAKDGATALNVTKFSKKKDGATAKFPGNRKGEETKKWTTALNKVR